MKKHEKQVYKIKFYFKDEKSYEVNYSYDSESKTIKYVSVKLGPEKKLKKYLFKEAVDLESALIYAMQQNKVINLTEESIKNSKEQIKNNLVKIDLSEDFLVDIIPDIFKLQNLCENNLQVEVWENFAPGTLNQMSNEEYLNKTNEILEKVKSIRGDNNSKMITFVEKAELNGGGMWGGTDNSWIQGHLCGQGGSDGYDNKYQEKYANWELKEIEQKEEEADISQKTKENQNLNDNQITPTQDLDSQKSENNEKISRAGKIARIIFLILLIAFAIFLPTYLGIVGLLFSNVAIPIVVFSVEAILIILIIILILSIKNIDSHNNLLKAQNNLGEVPFGDLETENSIDKNKNGQENQNNSEPNQLENNGQNLDEHNQNGK